MNILKSKWGTLLGLLFLVLFAFQVIQIQRSKQELAQDVEDLKARLAQVEDSNKNLEKELSSLENPEYLKTQAKIKLNYKMADEEVVFIYNDPNKQASATQNSGTSYENLPNYKKWWYWVLNK